MSTAPTIRLFLCGDVMTGRGIDQILPFPGDPTLHESYVRDARRYIELAERVSGTLPRTVEPGYPWGDLPAVLERAGADLRIINLETSITRSNDYWPGKGVHYRMNPANIACLAAAGVDCCALANNHVLDWGYAGLADTLRELDHAGIAHAGAGRDTAAATAPATLEVSGKGRVLVFSCGHVSSGIPPEWAAGPARAGVHLLPDCSERTAGRLAAEMTARARPGDLIVASIHWGPNWGYHVRDQESRFARRLVRDGVHVVHGHSSHHVKGIEIVEGRPLLYGCGDFINDYEGIGGKEEYRPDLALAYLPEFDPRHGRLVAVRLVPLQMQRFRLQRATISDVEWLAALLNRLGATTGTRVEVSANGELEVVWER
jgi:poly-gamma-glutamate synthesis protein (capsule biosynthesis protein)